MDAVKSKKAVMDSWKRVADSGNKQDGGKRHNESYCADKTWVRRSSYHEAGIDWHTYIQRKGGYF